jgi:uncharacterized protein YecE (DUF72 family)
MTLYVGTSGWAYKEWKPAFYPEDLPQARFLELYSHVLGAVEINATFYRLQSTETFAKWAATTPEQFRFATKAHRRLTHSKEMAPEGDARTFLDAYLRSVATLGPRLGVVLFQYPPYRRRDDAALDAIIAALPDGTRAAFEFRHDSWADAAVRDRIAQAGGTVCVSETEGKVPDALPPGPFAYIRLRAERYSPEARDGLRALLEKEGAERDVFAFAKHEGIPAGDPFGGIGFAVWLSGHVSRSDDPTPQPGAQPDLSSPPLDRPTPSP